MESKRRNSESAGRMTPCQVRRKRTSTRVCSSQGCESIRRLLDDGWIRRVDGPLPKGSKRERKTYTLTEQGWRVLNAEIERLCKLVKVAQIQTAEETL
jgi:DNA-binding PadR family transcriptional regulator